MYNAMRVVLVILSYLLQKRYFVFGHLGVLFGALYDLQCNFFLCFSVEK
jgi:hypothetical protein